MAIDTKESATVKVEEAAKILGIGRQTAYELAGRGELPGALRLGRRIVVSKRALEEFLKANGPEGVGTAPVADDTDRQGRVSGASL